MVLDFGRGGYWTWKGLSLISGGLVIGLGRVGFLYWNRYGDYEKGYGRCVFLHFAIHFIGLYGVSVA